MDYRNAAQALPWCRGSRILTCDTNGLLAIDKPAGVLSHPNRKKDKGVALLEAPYDAKLQAYRIADPSEGDELSVYLLNRLDSATSGVVLLALRSDVAEAVLKEFAAKAVAKRYSALVFGSCRSGPTVWRDRISIRHAEGGVRAATGGGAQAETRLAKVEPYQASLPMNRLTLMPVTGRTHQLRIQSAKRGLPIAGDRTYGDFAKNKLFAKASGIKRLCLHCAETELAYTLGGRRFSMKARSERPF